MSTVSAFTQLQNWFAGQAAVNRQIFGNPDAAPTADFSTAFANAANNFFSQKDSLAITALQTREVQKAQATKKPAATQSSADKSTTKPAADKTGPEPALIAARAAGKDILTNLGLISSPPKKTTPSSSSGPYTPPINAATGHAYVTTTAA